MSGRGRTAAGNSHRQPQAGGQVDAAGVSRELAVLVGGPKDRWWYWRDDLDRMQAAERRIAERQGDPHPERRPCSVLVYRPTERWLSNTVEPQYGIGRVWEHRLDDLDDVDGLGAHPLCDPAGQVTTRLLQDTADGTCPTCRRVAGYVIPTSLGQCLDCADPDDLAPADPSPSAAPDGSPGADRQETAA